jgi:flagellar biosynthesis regulator FlbT
MTLRIELKPFEELFISRSVIRNGPDRVSFAVSGTSPLLRGKDYIPASAVDTICKRLQHTVQMLYLEERDVQEALPTIEQMAHAVCMQVPKLTPQATSVVDQIRAGSLFKALKTSRVLVEMEADTALSGTAV